MKNKVKKSPIPVVAIMALLVGAIGFTFYSISTTLGDLSTEMNPEQTDILLASTELAVDSINSIPVNYYSQVADPCINIYDQSSKTALENRQFEWSECGYQHNAFEQGLVESTLNEDLLPVASGSGSFLPNRGLTVANFSRWFNSVDGLSEIKSDTISLQYSSNSKTFSYQSSNFHPVSSELFTMSLEIPFTTLLSGSEAFSITADDDTWVFMDDQLILDMGGIHSATEGVVTINESGELSVSIDGSSESRLDIVLSENQISRLRIFHANRDSSESIFKINLSNMYLNIFNTEIAYNDDGSAYIPPLGESSIFEPNHSSSILTSIIAQFFILGILLILTPVAVSFAVRRKQNR